MKRLKVSQVHLPRRNLFRNKTRLNVPMRVSSLHLNSRVITFKPSLHSQPSFLPRINMSSFTQRVELNFTKQFFCSQKTMDSNASLKTQKIQSGSGAKWEPNKRPEGKRFEEKRKSNFDSPRTEEMPAKQPSEKKQEGETDSRDFPINPRHQVEEIGRRFKSGVGLNNIEAFFRRCPSPSILHYNTMINGLAKRDKVDLMMKYYEELKQKKLRPTDGTFTPLLQCLSLQRRKEPLLELYTEQLEQYPETINFRSFNNVLRGFNKSSEDVPTMLKLYHHAKQRGMGMNCHVLTSLVEGAALEQTPVHLIEILKEFRDAGVEMDRTCYNQTLLAFARHGLSQTVKELYREMLDRGIDPSIQTYTALIIDAGRRKAISEVLGMIDEMKDRGLQPDRYTLGSILDQLGRMQAYPAQDRLFQQLVGTPNADEYIYGIMIKSKAARGELEEAQKLFVEVKNSKDLKINPAIYGTMIQAYLTRRMEEEATILLKELIESNFDLTLHHFNQFITYYATEINLGAPIASIQSKINDLIKIANLRDIPLTLRSLVSFYTSLGKICPLREDLYQNGDRRLNPHELKFYQIHQ